MTISSFVGYELLVAKDIASSVIVAGGSLPAPDSYAGRLGGVLAFDLPSGDAFVGFRNSNGFAPSSLTFAVHVLNGGATSWLAVPSLSAMLVPAAQPTLLDTTAIATTFAFARYSPGPYTIALVVAAQAVPAGVYSLSLLRRIA